MNGKTWKNKGIKDIYRKMTGGSDFWGPLKYGMFEHDTIYAITLLETVRPEVELSCDKDRVLNESW